MPPPHDSSKRKTLVERGGETARPAPAPPTSRFGNAYPKATSIAAASRDVSLSSSVSSRPSSVASVRNVSSSVGPGGRPPSTQSYRPQSAMSYSRIQRPTSKFSRPTMGAEAHPEEFSTSRTLGKRKGRTPFSSNPVDSPDCIKQPKTRGSFNTQMGCASSGESRPYNAIALREVSLNTQFTFLSLDEDPPQSAPKADVDTLCTPSQIPKPVFCNTLPAGTPSPSKPPKKTPKPLPMYLNRDSNTTLAWDTDSRLEEVENMCSEFKEKMDGATTESNSLKDIIAVYKIRSMSI